MGEWLIETIQRRVAAGQPTFVALDEDDRLLGALLTSEKGFDTAPPVRPMLKTWPGRVDAYVYGPVCIASPQRRSERSPAVT